MFEHENHDYLFIDIETIPEGEPDYESLPTREEMRRDMCKSKEALRNDAPKSYKKEEVINNWVEEKFINQEVELEDAYIKQLDDYEAEFRKGSLNSLKGRIFCISYAFNDGETKIVTYDPNEKRMMEKFDNALRTDLGEKAIYTTCWVGHNLKKFDIRWIAHRAMKYGLKDLLRYIPTGKFDKRIIDTNDMFNLSTYGCYDKLDHIAKFFGLDGKVGMSGDKVYDAFLDNKYAEIHKYCMEDVDMTRDIFNKMNI